VRLWSLKHLLYVIDSETTQVWKQMQPESDLQDSAMEEKILVMKEETKGEEQQWKFDKKPSLLGVVLQHWVLEVWFRYWLQFCQAQHLLLSLPCPEHLEDERFPKAILISPFQNEQPSAEAAFSLPP